MVLMQPVVKLLWTLLISLTLVVHNVEKSCVSAWQGTSKMVLECGKHPAQLKDMVCSPGGTTIAGVHQLEKSGCRAALMDAVEAAANQAKYLSRLGDSKK